VAHQSSAPHCGVIERGGGSSPVRGRRSGGGWSWHCRLAARGRGEARGTVGWARGRSEEAGTNRVIAAEEKLGAGLQVSSGSAECFACRGGGVACRGGPGSTTTQAHANGYVGSEQCCREVAAAEWVGAGAWRLSSRGGERAFGLAAQAVPQSPKPTAVIG
jgi:hypothetical protein